MSVACTARLQPLRGTGRLRGARQGATARPAPPGRGIRPLEPQNDVVVWEMTGAHASVETQVFLHLREVQPSTSLATALLKSASILIHHRHIPMRQSCSKHHLQGVWGRLYTQRVPVALPAGWRAAPRPLQMMFAARLSHRYMPMVNENAGRFQ